MAEVFYQLQFRDKASLEFDESYNWYEEQREGLGEEFAYEIKLKLDKILQDPYLYKKVSANLHEGVVDRFPFTIVFSVKEKQKIVIISAIFHTSRNPKSKYRR